MGRKTSPFQAAHSFHSRDKKIDLAASPDRTFAQNVPTRDFKRAIQLGRDMADVFAGGVDIKNVPVSLLSGSGYLSWPRPAQVGRPLGDGRGLEQAEVHRQM